MPETEDRISGIEVVRIPHSYLEQVNEASSKRTPNSRFNQVHEDLDRFLSALMLSEQVIAFRIQSVDRRTKVMYLTKNKRVRSDVIEPIYAASFPAFSVKPVIDLASPSIPSTAFCAVIYGVPQHSCHSLNIMTEVLIRSKSNFIFQTLAIPKKPGILSRQLAKKRLGSSLEKSRQQETSSSWFGKQETRTRIDIDALISSSRLKESYDRMTVSRGLDCKIVLILWGDDSSEMELTNAVNALLGTISPKNKDERMRARIFSGKRAMATIKANLDLERRGKMTFMRSNDAAPLFEIPSIEMGVVRFQHASFSTSGMILSRTESVRPKFTADNITLGNVYRNGVLDKNKVKLISLEELRRHTVILGMTGSGKSSTKNRIVIEAWRNGISSLLIEPVKTDARILMGEIEDLRIFTLGRESVSPFRLNPFLVEPGVPVQVHIDHLHSCFVAAWPLYGILTNHMRRVIVRTYVRNGWDPVTDIRGKPVSLNDFRAEAERYSELLGYGNELNQDFRGAILARVEDLCDPSRAVIINTDHNIPISELFAIPTIIELRHVQDIEFRALLLNLLLVRIWQYFDQLGPAEKLRNLLVIDEAHRLLEELPYVLDMSEAAVSQRQMLDQVSDMVAESRSVGLGMVLADQLATRLARIILKNCHVKIVHRLESPEDAHLMAQEMACNAEQTNHIGSLIDGEAVVRTPSNISPTNLQIFHDPYFNSDMKPNWKDSEVRSRMKEFFRKNPCFAETPEYDLNFHDEQLIQIAIESNDVVYSEDYQKSYLDAIESINENPASSQLEELLVFFASRCSDSDRSVIEIARALYNLSSSTYGPPSRKPDWNIVGALVSSQNETNTELEFRSGRNET